MTLPFERTSSVIETELFLKNLADPKVTPGLPSHIRHRAASLLRHYPTKHDLKFTAAGWGDKLQGFMFECPFADPDERFM